MLIDILYIISGFLLLTFGAEAMVSGAAHIATRFGIRPMVVGLTIVALGTSAPEMAVSLAASLSGRGDLAIGNVVGSNIGNIGLALGLAVFIRPLTVQIRLIRLEVPLLVVISLLVYLFAYGGILPQWFGLLLLVCLAIYITLLVRLSLKERSDVEAEFTLKDPEKDKPLLDFFKIVAGFSALAGGGQILVEGASGVARAFGVSDLVIGLTVVAIGTSLPEIVTSLVAVWRDHGDIAIGNVLGSNIFNTLAVLGSASAIRPITISREVLERDLPVMVVMTLLLFPFLRTGFTLRRWEGILLFLIYVAYIGNLAFNPV